MIIKFHLYYVLSTSLNSHNVIHLLITQSLYE